MAYNIVKHRRGTTQEWAELDLILIPEEGELVIEECSDGTRKCKIGTGSTRFSKLPYIDESTKEYLLEKLTVTETNLNKKLVELANTQDTKLSESISVLDTKLTNSITEETSKLASRMGELAEDVEKLDESVIALVQPSIGSLDTKYSKKLDEIMSQHANDAETISRNIDTKVAELATTFNGLLENHTAEASAALTSTAANLTTDYVVKIGDAKTALQNQIDTLKDEHSADITKVRNEITTKIDETEDATDKKIKASEDQINTLIEGLSTSLEQINETIDQLRQQNSTGGNTNVGVTIPTDLATQLKDLQNKVNQLDGNSSSLLSLLNEANTKIANLTLALDLAKQQHTTISDTAATLVSALDTRLSKADADLTAFVSEKITKIDAEIKDLVDDDLDLYEQLLKANNALEQQIRQIQETFGGENGTIASAVSDLNTRIDNEKLSLESQIASTKEDLTTKIAGVEKDLNGNIKNSRENLNIKINTNKNDINRLSSTVNDNYTNISGKIADIETTIEANKTAITVNRNNIDQAVSSTSTNFEVVNNKLDTLEGSLAAQVRRVTNLVAGSPTKETELSDIRIGYDGKRHDSAGDAVRAVGSEVKDLKTSLSQYIGTQAINGLLYDTAGEVGLMQPYTLYLKTTSGEVIQNSGVQIIGGSGGGGGGSSASSLKIERITPEIVVVTTESVLKDKVDLAFMFSGTDSSGDTIRRASSTWTVNGNTVEYGTVNAGENHFDVTKYLKVGTNVVLLLVKDANGGFITKSWSIQQVELSIEQIFNDKLTYSTSEDLIFTYVPNGAVEKEAVFILDNNEIGRVKLSADISGTPEKYLIPAQTHGSHLLEYYLEATINGDTVPSEHKTIDLLFYDPTSEIPVIGISKPTLNIRQYETTSIIYTVYDPTSATPEVTINIDNVDVSTVKLTANSPTSAYSYAGIEPGSHIIKFICRGFEKVVTVDVKKLDIDISPVTLGLAFDFNPVGRNNADIANREWNYGNIQMKTEPGFDWVNGGYIPDDPDGPCFCIKAGSRATIKYGLFADDAKEKGKEFKLVFKTKNVAKPDASFLSCLDNNIGIKMGVHNACIYGQDADDYLELSYSEEDIIEFEFNISPKTDKTPMVMGYEDGVPSRPWVYKKDTTNFKQSTPQEITLGSDECDLYIYRFKVYNTSLTASEILQNFIADARTPDEIISRFDRNQIYNEDHKLTPEALAEKCPWLRVYVISAPRFTTSKKDPVDDTTIRQIYKGGDPVLDNWTCYGAQHKGQGTTSDNYGAAGRNIDFIMNTPDSYFVLGNGETTDKITLTRKSVPVNYLTAKVNIASSNNITNAILAKRYNLFNPYRRPFVERDGVDTDFIKDTMEFHNCVIFIEETSPELGNHKEFNDTNCHFYAIGNIGDSKNTDNTRATDPNDKYECCIEISDIDLDLSDFPIDTMINAMEYKETTSGEREYTWAKTENLDKLYELRGDFIKTEDTVVVRNKAYYQFDSAQNAYKCVAYPSNQDLPKLYELNGDYIITSDTEVNLENTYFIDILKNNPMDKTNTYEWRYISDEKDQDVIDFCRQKWVDFYRFVTTSTDEEFRANLNRYFVEDSALYYYLFTTRYCMVDNRAKNTFWHYGKTGGVYDADIEIKNADGDIVFSAAEGEPIRKWDLCWDYDNDTALGLNNYGKQVYRYGLEDTDRTADGTEVFREMDSTFFCRIRDCFADKLKDMYQELESKEVPDPVNTDQAWSWSAASLLTECDAWQSEFPEELWRLDIERKYIRTYTSSHINGAGNAEFLTTMANGKMKYHRRQWERSQEKYMASKYQAAAATGDKATFRCTAPEGDLVVAPNYSVTLTPFAYMYLNVQYGNTDNIIQIKAQPNVPTPIPYTGGAPDPLIIYSASLIKDFGSLASCYPRTADISMATRIREFTLGTDTVGYKNGAFTTLPAESNPLLEKLNIENVTGLVGAPDLRSMVNLKTLYAYGTGISGVTFAEGGKIQEVELPAVTSISLKKLPYLRTEKFSLSSYENVVDLTIEDCPLISQIDILNRCLEHTKPADPENPDGPAIPILRRVRLTNIDFGEVTYEEFKAKVFGLKGLNATGGESANAELVGTVKFDTLTGAQFNELRKRYPDLTISYNTLKSTITFKDTDLKTTVHENVVISENNTVADYENPVDYENSEPIEGMIAKPIKTSIPEFEYRFLGWSTTPDIIVNAENDDTVTDEVRNSFRYEAVKQVEGDRTLYPVFEAVRRSYAVTFINPTIIGDGRILAVVLTPYGSPAIYNGMEPQKLDAASPDLYAFTGWYPLPNNIKGDLTCEAQFTVKDSDLDEDDSPGYTIGWADLTSNKPTDSLGYTLDEINDTMSITQCYNTRNAAIRVPESLTQSNKTFKIINLGGFKDHSQLELIEIPNTVKKLTEGAFANCNMLYEVTLPKYLTVIGDLAFKSCVKLKYFNIPASVKEIGNGILSGCSNIEQIIVEEGNSYFRVENNCLINMRTNTLIQGLVTGTIPENISLGVYCFAGMPIASIEIPNGIISIPENAFSSCKALTSVKLPANLTILGPTSFAWCDKLSEIILPEGLEEIHTYAFNGTNLKEVTIPASVTSILERAFGSISGLEKVTFNHSSSSIPDIHPKAFQSTGKSMEFILPWTRVEHLAKFRGTYTDVNGTYNRDIFFSANKDSVLTFIDGDSITKTSEGDQYDI